MKNTLLLSCDADLKPLLNHLFGERNWTKDELRNAGRAVHLTSSDAERGYNLSQIFGEIKQEDWRIGIEEYKKTLNK